MQGDIPQRTVAAASHLFSESHACFSVDQLFPGMIQGQRFRQTQFPEKPSGHNTMECQGYSRKLREGKARICSHGPRDG